MSYKLSFVKGVDIVAILLALTLPFILTTI